MNEHVSAIRAALEAIQWHRLPDDPQEINALHHDYELACNPVAITALLAKLDAQAVEIEKLRKRVMPDEVTPTMAEAMRCGSWKDCPSDELCRVRYAALRSAVVLENLK